MKTLATQFVTATDEVWRLQRGSDDECRFFQAMANRGHYRAKDGTRQGIYVCSPSGKFLASCNALQPDKVTEMMRQGLAAFRAMSREERSLPTDAKIKPAHRWEDSFPEDGLVLTAYNRDLPEDLKPDSACGLKFNRDHVWMTKAEARRMIPDDPKVGSVRDVPDDLVQRLARFHLVDTVRGQSLPYAAREVTGSKLKAEVIARDVPDVLVQRLARFHLVDTVRGQSLPYARREVAGSELKAEVIARDGDVVRIRITGQTQARAMGAWLMGESEWRPSREQPRGVVTEVLGYARYDLGRERFTEFDMVALGERHGATQHNGRRRDQGPAPIGFAFRLTGQTLDRRVPPAFINVYDVDWVVRPQRR